MASGSTAGDAADDTQTAAAPAPALATAPQQWCCTVCTFINPPARGTCEMCGNANPDAAAAPGVTAEDLDAAIARALQADMLAEAGSMGGDGGSHGMAFEPAALGSASGGVTFSVAPAAASNSAATSTPGTLFSLLGLVSHLSQQHACSPSSAACPVCVHASGDDRPRPLMAHLLEHLSEQADDADGSAPADASFSIGDRVFSCFSVAGRPGWFGGHVEVVHSDGTYDVHYDDGDRRRGLAHADVRSQPPRDAFVPTPADMATLAQAYATGGMGSRWRRARQWVQQSQQHSADASDTDGMSLADLAAQLNTGSGSGSDSDGGNRSSHAAAAARSTTRGARRAARHSPQPRDADFQGPVEEDIAGVYRSMVSFSIASLAGDGCATTTITTAPGAGGAGAGAGAGAAAPALVKDVASVLVAARARGSKNLAAWMREQSDGAVASSPDVAQPSSAHVPLPWTASRSEERMLVEQARSDATLAAAPPTAVGSHDGFGSGGTHASRLSGLGGAIMNRLTRRHSGHGDGDDAAVAPSPLVRVDSSELAHHARRDDRAHASHNVLQDLATAAAGTARRLFRRSDSHSSAGSDDTATDGLRSSHGATAHVPPVVPTRSSSLPAPPVPASAATHAVAAAPVPPARAAAHRSRSRSRSRSPSALSHTTGGSGASSGGGSILSMLLPNFGSRTRRSPSAAAAANTPAASDEVSTGGPARARSMSYDHGNNRSAAAVARIAPGDVVLGVGCMLNDAGVVSYGSCGDSASGQESECVSPDRVTVLEAVAEWLAAQGRDVSDLEALWSAVHPVAFGVQVHSSSADAQPRAFHRQPLGIHVLGGPLDRVVARLPPAEAAGGRLEGIDSIGFPDSAVESMQLLAVLRGVVQQARACDDAVVGAVLRHSHLVNHRLARQTVQCLQSASTVCRAALPPWCMTVATQYPFLLPLDARVRLFRTVAFGVMWAIKYMEGMWRAVLSAAWPWQ